MTDVGPYNWESPDACLYPMLANKVDWDKIPSRCAGYVMEPKLDGVRATIVKHGDDVRVYSRTLHRYEEHFPQLVWEARQWQEDFVLDGELGYLIQAHEDGNFTLPILDFNRTMRIVGSGPDVAIDKQGWYKDLYGAIEFEHGDRTFVGVTPENESRASNTFRHVRFWAFDLLWSSLEGNVMNKSEGERRRILEQFWTGHMTMDCATDGYFDIVPQLDHWSEAEYQDYVQAGGEGMILKNPLARYVPGKRPANNWYKVKKFESIDVVITGYTPGEGKYEGMIGAIEFEYHDRTFRCSGMDDATRATLSRTRPTGVTIEVRHFGFVGTDGLRFPQFLRFRPDKDPT